MAERSFVPGTVAASTSASVFDQVPAVYAFCREYLFRDDTERMIAALWPAGRPPAGTRLLELGCGPGFYARRLAARFPELIVTGLDRSVAQLARAQARLSQDPLPNCQFDLGDAAMLPYPDASVDTVISARLLATVEAPARVIDEVYRVLAPGGRCFVAEPRGQIRAAIPIAAMRVVARIDAVRNGSQASGASADRMNVLDRETFGGALEARAWARIRQWEDGPYQYAVLEKTDRDQGAAAVAGAVTAGAA